MGSLYGCELERRKIYWDRQRFAGVGPATAALHRTSSLYLGGVNTYSSDAQICASFSQIGRIDHVRLGLHAQEKTPCGFAFVEFAEAKSALLAMVLSNGLLLDACAIRTELDPGFLHGRQFGRGKKGGQAWKEKSTPRSVSGRIGRRGVQGFPGGRRRYHRHGGRRREGYLERDRLPHKTGLGVAARQATKDTTSIQRDGSARRDDLRQPDESNLRPRKRPRLDEGGDKEHRGKAGPEGVADEESFVQRRGSSDSHYNPRFREDRDTLSDDD